MFLISPRQRHIVFDLDGVLVDTRPLVVKAYQAAGVTMPQTAWGHSWREWLIDVYSGDEERAVQVHERKIKAYEEILRTVPIPRLACADVARASLDMDVWTYVLTSATYRTTKIILDRIGLTDMRVLAAECTIPEKAFALRTIPRLGFYLDDNPRLGREVVRSAPGWRLLEYRPDIPKRKILEAVWTL